MDPEQEIDVRRQRVVGAALLREGRLLAARRTAPAELAGRWELPGGKVEPGETPDGAIVREVTEELGVRAIVTGWLDGVVKIGDAYELVIATMVAEGDPQPREHDQLVWLGAVDLDTVDWLDSDRPFLPQIQGMIGA